MVVSEVVLVCWIYGMKNYYALIQLIFAVNINCPLNLLTGLAQIVKDARFMLGFGVGIYWKLTWSIIIPIALSIIFIYSMVLYEPLTTGDGEPYPPGVMGKSSFHLTIFYTESTSSLFSYFTSGGLGNCSDRYFATSRVGLVCDQQTGWENVV